jgi:hypothetical protein
MQEKPVSARYAVAFGTGSGALISGALVLAETSLLLLGRSGGDSVELSVPYSEVCRVSIGRSREETVDGRPTVMLGRRNAPPVRIEPHGAGLLHELADRLDALATRHADSGEQVAVIVPLRKGCAAKARELVAAGPPFDPALLGLSRHEVFVSEREAVFVFTGAHIREKLGRATRNPTLWVAGLAWTACVAGRPRLTNPRDTGSEANTEPVYHWVAAPEQTKETSLAPP